MKGLRGRPRKAETGAQSLRALRLAAGLSQPQAQRRIEACLGRKIGSGTISRWETYQEPGAEMIPAIAGVYGVPLEDVFYAISQDRRMRLARTNSEAQEATR